MPSITYTSHKIYAFVAASVLALSTQGAIFAGIDQMAESAVASTSQQAVVTLPTVTVVYHRS